MSALVSRAAALRPFSRRGSISALRSGARLVDDSYNASPAATRTMLAALKATTVSGRRVAVIGEMLELGDATRELHAECGRAAVAAGVEELVVIGGAGANALADAAAQAGLDRSRIHRFVESRSAADAIAGIVRSGDVVLVKGSRGTRVDVVSDRLQEVG